MQNNNLNIVVIGASGALGSEFVKQCADDEKTASVYAFSRSKAEFSSDKVKSHSIDIEDENSIKSASQIASKDVKIDMVIVATGMLHDDKIMPEKSLKDLSAEKFNKIFSINTIAPALIAKYFLPLLNKERRSIFTAISARVSSISDNRLGGWYSYRASKSALNMVLKNSAIEVKRSNKNAMIVGLHPGTVNSKLSKPFQAGVVSDKLFTPQYSVQKMLEVLKEKTPEDSGDLFDFNGIKIEF